MSSSFNKVPVHELLNEEAAGTSSSARPSSIATNIDGVPNIRCEINACGKRFATMDSLIAHQKRQHAAPTSFVCSFCRSTYSTLPNLNKHIRSVHHKIRPFKCDKCVASFAFRDGLQRHKEMVHQNIRPFACTYCPLKFKTKSNLHKHLLALHPKRENVHSRQNETAR